MKKIKLKWLTGSTIHFVCNCHTELMIYTLLQNLVSAEYEHRIKFPFP